MCLSKVDEVTKEYTEGYKVFNVNEANGLGIQGEYYTLEKFKLDGYPKRKWIKCNPGIINGKRIVTATEIIKFTYPAGFHFFTSLENAKLWYEGFTGDTIFKVKVRNILCSGQQETRGEILEVGVAEEMYIEEEVYRRD